MNITYEESNWSRIVRYVSLLVMIVVSTLVGCETLRTPRVTDLRIDSVVETEEVVQEGRGLSAGNFLTKLREACRIKGGFQLDHEGTVEHYACYPIEPTGG